MRAIDQESRPTPGDGPCAYLDPRSAEAFDCGHRGSQAFRDSSPRSTLRRHRPRRHRRHDALRRGWHTRLAGVVGRLALPAGGAAAPTSVRRARGGAGARAAATCSRLRGRRLPRSRPCASSTTTSAARAERRTTRSKPPRRRDAGSACGASCGPRHGRRGVGDVAPGAVTAVAARLTCAVAGSVPNASVAAPSAHAPAPTPGAAHLQPLRPRTEIVCNGSHDASSVRGRWSSAQRSCCCRGAAAAQGPAALTVVSTGPDGRARHPRPRPTRSASSSRSRWSRWGGFPSPVTAPFVRITPAIPGTFRWSGTTILIFTPDPKRPLPYATSYEVTVDATATAVSGRTLARAGHASASRRRRCSCCRPTGTGAAAP